MQLAEIIYDQVKALPEPLAREVLDFVGYLSQRAEQDNWRELMKSQDTGLTGVWENAHDAVWDDL